MNNDKSQPREQALFDAAIDAAYPIPDSPHTSVMQRANDARAAFTRGWQARAPRQAAPEAPTEQAGKLCGDCDEGWIYNTSHTVSMPCPRCYNRAATTASASECPKCHGSESVSDPNGWQLERIPCPECAGRAPAPSRNAAPLRERYIKDMEDTLAQIGELVGVKDDADKLLTTLRAALTQQSAAQAPARPLDDPKMAAYLRNEPWISAYIETLECELRKAQASHAGADTEKQAARYRWLRDKSEPGICAFYLSVGQAFKDVKFAKETVDDAIDAQIAAMSAATPGPT